MGQERVKKARSPRRWAVDISGILNLVRGPDHFPISVTEVALELSKQLFPEDPLSLIHGENLPGFDGALLPINSGKKGWGILYNNGITSKGRINFTLAHEFGHYLIHRLAFPDGMRCNQQDVLRWESEYKRVEHEANTFAAYLLMPLDDYRRQIDSRSAVTFDLLSHCAERYEVSLVAATLRWLLYTERRAVLVVSRDGFILWARSSEAAFKSRIYIKTSGLVVSVPDASVAAHPEAFADARIGVNHPPGVWFPEPCQETSIVSENYDFTLSLIQLPPSNTYRGFSEDDEDERETASDQIRRVHRL
ncbi:MAG: ImmA/IrrE family metallo-endopeptidase [Gammaproteobacteria bacterium]